MNQLGELAVDHTKYKDKEVEIIALAVQPQDEAARTVEKTKAQYPVLADNEHVVAEQYGVYSLFNDSEAAASVFIIGHDGRIIWDHVATVMTDRVPSDTILENLP
jgi:peroxiredoxin